MLAAHLARVVVPTKIYFLRRPLPRWNARVMEFAANIVYTLTAHVGWPQRVQHVNERGARIGVTKGAGAMLDIFTKTLLFAIRRAAV